VTPLILLLYLPCPLAGITLLTALLYHRQRDGSALTRSLLVFQISFCLFFILNFIKNYLAVNIVGVDPGALQSIVAWIQASRILYAFLLLEYAFLYFLYYSTLRVILVLAWGKIPHVKGVFLALLFSVMAMLLIGGNILIPLFHESGTREQAIPRIVSSILGILQIFWILFFTVFALRIWLQNRNRTPYKSKRRLGDQFSIVLGASIFCQFCISIVLPYAHIDSKTASLVSSLLGSYANAFGFDLFILLYIIKRPENNPMQSPGKTLVPPDFLERYRLTDREREIIGLLHQGLSNKEICQRLELSHGTVKNHVSNLYRKLGIERRDDLLLILDQFS
jgi:DNA-binding CsgD family transcriptional regulator